MNLNYSIIHNKVCRHDNHGIDVFVLLISFIVDGMGEAKQEFAV